MKRLSRQWPIRVGGPKGVGIYVDALKAAGKDPNPYSIVQPRALRRGFRGVKLDRLDRTKIHIRVKAGLPQLLISI